MVKIETIFKDKGIKLFDLIHKINNYNINENFPSMKKTIRNFNPDHIYDEILDFIMCKDDDIMALEIGFIKYLYKFVYSEQGGE